MIWSRSAGPLSSGPPPDMAPHNAIATFILMFPWIGHLIVGAFIILALDTVAAKLNSFRGQNSGTGVAMVVGEHGSRHRDRKPGFAGQGRKQDLGFHLGLSAITDGVVGVAGKLHEQAGGGGRRSVVFDA